MPTHYEVLGVSPTSEQEVIDAAYKALIRKYHPDRVGENGRIRQINAAYAVLSNVLTRRAYDAEVDLASSRKLAVHQPAASSKSRPPGRRDTLKRCPDCFEYIPKQARVCSNCGYRFSLATKQTSHKVRVGWGIAGLLLFLLVILGLFSEGEEPVSHELVSSTEAGACDADSVQVDLGSLEATGTIEVLAPKPDTDAFNQFVISLSNGSCIDRAAVDELAKASGQHGPVTFLIGHDPNGMLHHFRTRFAYETDGLTPLSEMPLPPRDMHFGEARWDVNRKSQRLIISWYGNFRKWQEQHYSADAAVADAPPAPTPKQEWDSYNAAPFSARVLWAKSGSISQIEFYTGTNAEMLAVCSAPTTERVEIVAVDPETNHFRARNGAGDIETYLVPYEQVPNVVASYVEAMVKEGSALNVTTAACGSLGAIYVTALAQP